MNDLSRGTLDDYYAEASSWNRDRVLAMRSSQRLAWWIACGAATIAVLQAIALVLLTPLKTVVPYTLMVDRNTGYVQALNQLDPARVAPDTALTQSYLVQYVTAREGFELAVLKSNYRKIALFSAGSARSNYLATMRASNPASPLSVYPRTAVVDVQVKSVSPLDANSALVRFDTIRSDAGGQTQPASSWVAVLRYRYSGAPMKLEDRFINPLGFQVTSYRRDPEAAPPPTEAVTQNPVAAIPSVLPYYRAQPAGASGR